jgi:hypothetical protein
MDDRMLPEAVAPLLESLAGCPDVAAPLARRFNMQRCGGWGIICI